MNQARLLGPPSAVALLLATLGWMAVVPAPAHAAEYTDLLDAADDFDDLDESTWDPFDLTAGIGFRYDIGSGRISREAPCVPSTSGLDPLIAENRRLVVDPGRCSDPAIVYNKEMLYQERRSTLLMELRAGIYKDLELKLTVPYVLGFSRGLKYANEAADPANVVDPTRSSVDPSDGIIQGEAERVFGGDDPVTSHAEAAARLDQFNTYRYFDLQEDYIAYDRSGFGDPSIGLQWAPFNDERDDTKATLVLGMEYLMPLAPVMQGGIGNDALGRGVHELSWRLASSKRFDWIEPYLGLEYFLPLPATNSLYGQVDKSNQGQIFTNPPQRGEVTIGSEFIPHENRSTGARFGIDLRFTFGYVSEGRDYTPLFDHLARSQCRGKTLQEILPDDGTAITEDIGCAWILQQPSNAEPEPVYDLAAAAERGDTSTYAFDGIMTVESHATFSGMVGFYMQPMRNLRIDLAGSLTAQQEHFITNARTGRDVEEEETDDETVDLEGADASLERNPVHNPTYDTSGNRFRLQGFTTWSILVNVNLQF